MDTSSTSVKKKRVMSLHQINAYYKGQATGKNLASLMLYHFQVSAGGVLTRAPEVLITRYLSPGSPEITGEGHRYNFH